MVLNYFNNPTVLIIASIVMVMALIFHNIAQAWMASRYGDHTPKYQGFTQFDPQTHLEPMGVLFLFLLGFGWTKAVPVNSRNYSGRGRIEALVWYTGPLAYLLVAAVSYTIAFVFLRAASAQLAQAFVVAGDVAVLHAVINVFPVFPLDGARAALAWGDRSVRQFVQQLAQFGIIGFIVIFMLLSATGVTGAIMGFFRGAILGGLSAIFNLFG
ncbi:membrane protein [soil metagenome]|nr:site-2 protease family protein [Trueperaceae bacterium]